MKGHVRTALLLFDPPSKVMVPDMYFMILIKLMLILSVYDQLIKTN